MCFFPYLIILLLIQNGSSRFSLKIHFAKRYLNFLFRIFGVIIHEVAYCLGGSVPPNLKKITLPFKTCPLH